MTVLMLSKVLTLGTDKQRAIFILENDGRFEELGEALCEVNEKYEMVLLEEEELATVVKQCKNVLNAYIYSNNGIKLRNYNLIADGISVIKVENQKVYDLSNEDAQSPTDKEKEELLPILKALIEEKAERLSIDPTMISEQFICLYVNMLEKNRSLIIIEPRELSKNNHLPCWRCNLPVSSDDEEDDEWEDF